MRDGKVVRQIEAMDGRERERLRQFVESPYFNRHAATTALLSFVLAELGKNRPRLTEDRALRALKDHPTKQSLSDLMSGLMKLVNRFLAVEQLREEEFREAVLTIKRTDALKRERLLENRGKRLERRLEKRDRRDADLHLIAYEWKNINAYRVVEDNRDDTDEILSTLDHLDRFYMVEKLRHGYHLTANAMMRSKEYNIRFLTPILDFLATPEGRKLRKDDREAGIDCYYHALLTLLEPDQTEHYDYLRHYLNEGSGRLTEAQVRDAFTFATNYCIHRIRLGDRDPYLHELLRVYERGIATGALYKLGVMSEYDYKNITTVGIALREFDWVEDFLETQKHFISVTSRENAYAYNRANLLYHRGELDASARLLARVTDSDLTYHVNRIPLQVQIAFEQDDQEYALHLLENFRLFCLRNKKINAGHRREYINYTKLCKQLVNLRFQRGYVEREIYERKLADLHTAIKADSGSLGRTWLLRESAPTVTA